MLFTNCTIELSGVERFFKSSPENSLLKKLFEPENRLNFYEMKDFTVNLRVSRRCLEEKVQNDIASSKGL